MWNRQRNGFTRAVSHQIGPPDGFGEAGVLAGGRGSLLAAPALHAALL